MVAINQTKSSLNFSGGIHSVTRLDRQADIPDLPQAKKIIYFTDDALPTHLSKVFPRFKGKSLVDKICRPCREEVEKLQADYSGRQALNALNWLKALDADIDSELRDAAEKILTESVELELKEQVQRNLLKQV